MPGAAIVEQDHAMAAGDPRGDPGPEARARPEPHDHENRLTRRAGLDRAVLVPGDLAVASGLHETTMSYAPPRCQARSRERRCSFRAEAVGSASRSPSGPRATGPTSR